MRSIDTRVALLGAWMGGLVSGCGGGQSEATEPRPEPTPQVAPTGQTPDEPSGPLEGLRVKVEAVLPDVTWNAADRRYWEVTLLANARGEAAMDAAAARREAFPEEVVGCRTDLFFVHFPPSERSDRQVEGITAERLEQAIAARLGAMTWRDFAPSPRRGLEEAAREGTPVKVREDALDPLVRLLERAAADLDVVRGAAPSSRPRAADSGPVCHALAAQVSDAGLSWHLHRLGLAGAVARPTRRRSLSASPAALRRVHVALVDSGLGLGRNPPDEEVSVVGVAPLPAADHHPHGGQMARLLRQVAPSPRVKLSSFRVLGEDGRGTVHDVARGLGAALMHRFPEGEPLIVNLSLVWPAPLAERWGSSGWPVRHLLALAARLDASEGDRRVAAFAATGNHPGRIYMATRETKELGTSPNTSWPPRYRSSWALAADPNGMTASWDFPGEWAFLRQHSRIDPVHLIAVGATNQYDLPASVMRGGQEAPLAAPGEMVFVEEPGGEVQAGGVAGTLLTGTSVSAVLASATAAMLQTSANTPLRAGALYHLLYGSAVPVGSDSAAPRAGRQGPGLPTAPVRRLDTCRALQLQRCVQTDARCSASFLGWAASSPTGQAHAPPTLDTIGSDMQLPAVEPNLTDCHECLGGLPACETPAMGALNVDRDPASNPEAAGPAVTCTSNEPICEFEQALWYEISRSPQRPVRPAPGIPRCPQCDLIPPGVSYQVFVDYIDVNSDFVGRAWLVVQPSGQQATWYPLQNGTTPRPTFQAFPPTHYSVPLNPAPSQGTSIHVVTEVFSAPNGGQLLYNDWSPLAFP